MSIAPGSSGSPLFNRDMEVIGITSHGVPKGDAVAQRAEVLRDLMLPLAEEEALDHRHLDVEHRALGERRAVGHEVLELELEGQSGPAQLHRPAGHGVLDA